MTPDMRKLILLRGLPGSGKSTFIKQHDLEPYTLSTDTLRMHYGSLTYEAGGRLRIPAEYDKQVWQKLLDLLNERMARGELVIVDATHSNPRSFAPYEKLAKDHRYQVLCVDFANISLATCIERNNGRHAWKALPRVEMERMAANLERARIPKWVTAITPEEFNTALAYEPTDVSHYTAINHIGDIQGCYTPLAEYFEIYGINDDELYVFVGDYLDRGTQNAQVMEWVLKHYNRPNFIFIEGNHEAHLRNWTNGQPARSRQFTYATQPELEAAGFLPKKVHGFLYKLREVFYYTFNGRDVLVTHGGLSAMPKNLTFTTSKQLIKGAGLYEEADIADASFAKLAPANAYQVHGHRNRFSSPTQVNEKCFNLEGKVEFGGELRAVRLSKDGFEERSIKSTIDATASVVEAVGPQKTASTSVEQLVASLRGSAGIFEKPQPNTTISSFNFSRDIFYKKAWDDLNLHARGLFINTSHNVIVARAYEKFFNVNERPETQAATLFTSLAYPVKAWVKENGYLGLVGYDPQQDALVFASKSSLTSEFAGWLEQQFNALAPPSSMQRKEIELYLKSGGGKTLVFEVIEPANDPHIVEHETPHMVLLDIVKNVAHFEAASEQERQRIASLLGCQPKQLGALLKDAAALEGWLQSVQDFNYLYKNRTIEGFVLEDSAGFMVKIKLPWYAFWRQMRTQLERAKAGKSTQPPTFEINNELALAFLAYLAALPPHIVEQADIISLRRDFESKA